MLNHIVKHIVYVNYVVIMQTSICERPGPFFSSILPQISFSSFKFWCCSLRRWLIKSHHISMQLNFTQCGVMRRYIKQGLLGSKKEWKRNKNKTALMLFFTGQEDWESGTLNKLAGGACFFILPVLLVTVFEWMDLSFHCKSGSKTWNCLMRSRNCVCAAAGHSTFRPCPSQWVSLSTACCYYKLHIVWSWLENTKIQALSLKK